jgi:hypothetical protein
MTRSSVRFPSRGRAALVALLFGAASLLATSPASAKKKKPASSAPATDTEAPAEGGESGDKADKNATPAAQASDTEKPKPALDMNQEAPKTDSLGHIHFGTPNAEGSGRVAVKAPPEQKIKVFLEGRYFGTAPLTIYSVPKGDYILEAMMPSGKQVSKPVTVGENEETAIDLGAPQALSGEASGGMLTAEMTPGRMHLTEAFLAVAAVGVVGAVTFGILELKDESDYNNATSQAQRDDISNKGNRDALLTNVSIGVAAAGLVGAAIAGYPLVLGGKSTEEKKTTTALVVTPTVGRSGGGGMLSFRF